MSAGPLAGGSVRVFVRAADDDHAIALAIWKRLPAGRRDEALKRMSAVGANRLHRAVGRAPGSSPALQQLNRRMQIVLISARPSGVRTYDIGVDASRAGSGSALQALNVNDGQGNDLAPFDVLTPDVPVTYTAPGTFGVFASDPANTEVRGLRDLVVP